MVMIPIRPELYTQPTNNVASLVDCHKQLFPLSTAHDESLKKIPVYFANSVRACLYVSAVCTGCSAMNGEMWELAVECLAITSDMLKTPDIHKHISQDYVAK